MKNLLFILFAVITFSSCDSESGSGNVITRNRTTPSFTKLHASEGIDVEVRNGAYALKIEADDNLMDLIETTVDNGTLNIGIKDNVSLNDVHIKVYVTAPELSAVNASSGATVDVKDVLKYGGTIVLKASSSGEVTTAVDAPGVNADASSGSEIKISGRTKNFEANSSSGSAIRAFELLTESTNAEASSGASIDAFASVSLDGNASSGGDITYKGAATLVKKQESSGGSVNKEN